jgi:hypothetical protein
MDVETFAVAHVELIAVAWFLACWCAGLVTTLVVSKAL